MGKVGGDWGVWIDGGEWMWRWEEKGDRRNEEEKGRRTD